MCFYSSLRPCKTVVVWEKICTPDTELLIISLHPYEFQQLFFTTLYINPRAKVSATAQLIADVTHRLDTICLDAPKFILRYFNHCTLNKTLKIYEQYVSCITTQKNTTIELCYRSVSGPYKSLGIPSLGALYHNSVYL